MMNQRIGLLILGCFMTTFLLSGCGSNILTDSDELQAGYYKQLVMKPNGEFIAKDKLNEKKAAESGLVYKVEMNEQKKVAKITAMYKEQPLDQEWFDSRYTCYGSFAVISMEYQDGYVKYNFKNARMQPATGYYGSYSIRYKLDDKLVPRIAYYYNKDGEQAENGNGFAQMLFTYDDKSLLTKVGYANSSGERVTNKWKEYETQFKYDEHSKKNSLPVEVSNHGKDGGLMLNATNVAKKVYKYDDKGRLLEIRHFGTDENLRERTLDKFHLNRMFGGIGTGAVTKYKYEGEQKQPSEISFYGQDEQPIGIKNLGNVASFKFKYNEKGMPIEWSAYGSDGMLTALNKAEFGMQVTTIKQDIDEFGNVIEISFFNKENNLASLQGKKIAVIKAKYDAKRQKTEESYFGTSQETVDEMVYGQQGYHKKMMEYDEAGKVVKTTYYDKNDQVATINPMKNFYGHWARVNEQGEIMQDIIFAENELTIIPLLAERVPREKWDRSAYTVNTVNIGQNGTGYAVLKVEGSSSLLRCTLKGTDFMVMQKETTDSFSTNWKKLSS